jgi:hypothetical protein
MTQGMATKREKRERKPSGATWRTRDGRTIPIASMDDQHLHNCIRFLERAHARYVADLMAHPPHFQGEMAQYYAEAEWLESTTSDVEELFPVYDDLRIEAALRHDRAMRAKGKE